jgi:hypothetical protein
MDIVYTSNSHFGGSLTERDTAEFYGQISSGGERFHDVERVLGGRAR